jgi:hypothetical protein
MRMTAHLLNRPAKQRRIVPVRQQRSSDIFRKFHSPGRK